jgi:hypothetical protein
VGRVASAMLVLVIVACIASSAPAGLLRGLLSHLAQLAVAEDLLIQSHVLVPARSGTIGALALALVTLLWCGLLLTLDARDRKRP